MVSSYLWVDDALPLAALRIGCGDFAIPAKIESEDSDFSRSKLVCLLLLYHAERVLFRREQTCR
jgi:hypothetical protein